MKKTLLLLAIAATIFSSCKKEHGLTTKVSSAKKYAVHIQVANFTVSHANFALRTKGSHLASSSDTLTNLASYVDRLYYVVVDSNFKWVKTIAQDSTMANMGTITDSLAPGNYNIGIIAGKNELKIGPPGIVANNPLYGYAGQSWQGSFWSAYPNGYVGLPWEDTFQDEFPITVSAQNISQTITLNRVVGKLEVTLLDNIPANADSLFVSNYGPGPANSLGNAFAAVNNNYQFAIPASAKGQPNFTIDILIYNNIGIYYGDGSVQQFTITCKDAGGNVLGTRTVNSVIITANQKTILSGNLFTSTQSFTTQIDTAWSSGVTQVGFSLKHH
jgi:hypothetical protein